MGMKGTTISITGGFKMKRYLVVMTMVLVLGFAGAAFAHGQGYGDHMGQGNGNQGYGNHMGQGYGNHMGQGNGNQGYGNHMGQGYGNHMRSDYSDSKEVQEFLDKTAELRREFNEKRFDFREAKRAGDDKTADKLAKQLDELQEKLYKEAPKERSYSQSGNGRGCW
jgi:hypothetical protein